MMIGAWGPGGLPSTPPQSQHGRGGVPVLGEYEEVDTSKWPDAFGEEPIVAYRAWVAYPEGDEFLLRSVTYSDFVWPKFAPAEAVCNPLMAMPSNVHPLGDELCPAHSHGCGIHGVKEVRHATEWGNYKRDGVQVTGKVSLWGRVYRHKKGYRAQYAYPYDLFVLDYRNTLQGQHDASQEWKELGIDPQEVVRALRKSYGVDVQVGRPS